MPYHPAPTWALEPEYDRKRENYIQPVYGELLERTPLSSLKGDELSSFLLSLAVPKVCFAKKGARRSIATSGEHYSYRHFFVKVRRTLLTHSICVAETKCLISLLPANLNTASSMHFISDSGRVRHIF